MLSDKDFEDVIPNTRGQGRNPQTTLPIRQVPTRRFRLNPAGRRIDMRATLREAARMGGDLSRIKRRKRLRRAPPLVVLCDISGSMDRYARMILHFLHALSNDRDRVHTFLFGTRLTNVTRYLRYKDPDAAIDRISDAVRTGPAGHVLAVAVVNLTRIGRVGYYPRGFRPYDYRRA